MGKKVPVRTKTVAGDRGAPALGRAGVLATCLIAASVTTGAWADQTQADLVIHASGFAHARGQAIADLFREGEDIFDKPAARVAAAIQQGRANLTFPRLAYGSYAVTVFHDENGNGKLDHNFLRLPAEPLGFSNGFSLSLFSGMPSFQKLRFAFAGDTGPLEIRVDETSVK